MTTLGTQKQNKTKPMR